jgi:N-glycosylase/DNA lyase
MQLTIRPPTDFNFYRTVLSHGWCELLPFELDRENWKLTRVLDLERGKPVTVEVSTRKGALKILVSRQVSDRAAQKIRRDVRHMFRLDDDLNHFYQITSTEPEFAWIAEQGAGRLLRSPTVFEDLVKMICTTNCSWALTEKMVTSLVRELGTAADEGRKSFPTAEVMDRFIATRSAQAIARLT